MNAFLGNMARRLSYCFFFYIYMICLMICLFRKYSDLHTVCLYNEI